MTNINLRDVEKIIAKKEKEGITFKEAAESYAEAHGCGYTEVPIRKTAGGMICKRVYEPVRPLPCMRDEHGEIREKTVKQLFAKINEELDELKDSVVYGVDSGRLLSVAKDKTFCPEYIAEEAADTITAITTMLEALGIGAEMRDDAQRRVNEKNRERGRL